MEKVHWLVLVGLPVNHNSAGQESELSLLFFNVSARITHCCAGGTAKKASAASGPCTPSSQRRFVRHCQRVVLIVSPFSFIFAEKPVAEYGGV
ncbi:MAG: hypothetical protein IJK40_05435 [Clostridia bacterium]|nr:hypothetical protein [Clostridia bacterium]